MDKLRVVFAREYLERVRTRWFLIATIFGPLVFGALIFVPPWLASRSKASSDVSRIVILDATGTTLGRSIANELNGGLQGDTSRTAVRAVTPATLAAAESLATRQAISNTVLGYLVVDSATLSGHSARYAGTNATSSADMERLQKIVQTKVLEQRLAQAGVDPFQSAALTRINVDLNADRISQRGRGGSAKVSIYFAFAVALLLYTSILFYGQAVLRSVIDEKQSRVAEVVVASVPARTLLAGKVLGVGAVGLTQMLIWVAASYALVRLRVQMLTHMGLPIGHSILPDISLSLAIVLLLFFLLGYIFYAALFAAVGATVSNEQDAQQAQMPIIMLLIVSIFALTPILTAPQSSLAYTMGWLPFSAPIVMPLRMSVVSLEPLDIGTSLVILGCSCYIAVWLAARVYRTGLLMYGKRATVSEVLRWVGRAR